MTTMLEDYNGYNTMNGWHNQCVWKHAICLQMDVCYGRSYIVACDDTYTPIT
jgi:hypothetical protein